MGKVIPELNDKLTGARLFDSLISQKYYYHHVILCLACIAFQDQWSLKLNIAISFVIIITDVREAIVQKITEFYEIIS